MPSQSLKNINLKGSWYDNYRKRLEIFFMNKRYIQIEKVKDNSWKSCVICYGHFTYLHAGHLRYLREASKMKNNILIVLSKGPLGDGSESDLNERVDLIMSMFGEVNIIYADNKEIKRIIGKKIETIVSSRLA